MRYLWSSERDARRRVMHLCGHDPRSGEPTFAPLCGRVHLLWDRTSNVPWGQAVCRWCRTVAAAPSPSEESGE